MKRNLSVLSAICMLSLLMACGPKKLDESQALEIIKKEYSTPKFYDFKIYCADPKTAAKLLDAGLEQEGFVILKHSYSLMDVGKPLVAFTEKSKPYLLSTPEEDKKISVQLVKLADIKLGSITGIKTAEDGKSVIVDYYETYQNISPFSKITSKNFDKKNLKTAYFSLYDDGWRLKKKEEL